MSETLAKSYFTHANLLVKQGQLEAAVQSYHRAIELNAAFTEAYLNLGTALVALQRLDEALTCYDRAIALKPNYTLVYVNRGVVLKNINRLDEAVLSYQHAISINPHYAPAYFNLGNAQHELKQFEAAVNSFNQAITINPNYAQAFDNLGLVLQKLDFLDAAIESYDCAIHIKPDFIDAYINRANAQTELSHLDEALESYAAAFAIKPDSDYLLGLLLQAKMRLCDWSDFNKHTSELVARIERGEKASTCFPLLYLIDSLKIQLENAKIFTADKRPFKNGLGELSKRTPSQKIRIGYFSPDFHLHAVSILMAEVFELHDKNRFEIFAFYYGPDKKDDMRARVEKAFDRFIDVRNRSDQEAALLARQLNIDIAVDLGGETIHSRPNIFSYRAAPVQVGYLGFPGTMGADYYDYLIADSIIVPAKSQPFYAEKIAYLPSYQANDSKRVISGKQFTRQELGLPDEGFIFCCFNDNYKIIPDTFDSWMRILNAVPNTCLFLFVDNDTAKNNLKKEANKRGVEATRLVFGDYLSPDEYLARFQVADLFLDTFPYNVGTTASDALWAGLPVLTRSGETFASRVAASLLTAIGLPELITQTTSDYETLAIELATHPAKLKSIKEKLAANRLTTPLFNTPLFTRNLEEAFVKMMEQ